MAESQGHFIARQQPLEFALMKSFASQCAFSLSTRTAWSRALHISIWPAPACT